MAVTGCPSHGVFTFPPEVQPRNPFSGWAGSGQGIHQPIGCLGAPETLVARDLESTGPATCPPVLAPAGPSTAAPAIVLTLNHRPCLPRPRWESWVFLPSCLQSQARGLTPSQRFGHPTGRPQVSPLHNAGPSECAQAHCRLAHSTHAGFWSPSACEAPVKANHEGTCPGDRPPSTEQASLTPSGARPGSASSRPTASRFPRCERDLWQDFPVASGA